MSSRKWVWSSDRRSPRDIWAGVGRGVWGRERGNVMGAGGGEGEGFEGVPTTPDTPGWMNNNIKNHIVSRGKCLPEFLRGPYVKTDIVTRELKFFDTAFTRWILWSYWIHLLNIQKMSIVIKSVLFTYNCTPFIYARCILVPSHVYSCSMHAICITWSISLK